MVSIGNEDVMWIDFISGMVRYKKPIFQYFTNKITQMQVNIMPFMDGTGVVRQHHVGSFVVLHCLLHLNLLFSVYRLRGGCLWTTNTLFLFEAKVSRKGGRVGSGSILLGWWVLLEWPIESSKVRQFRTHSIHGTGIFTYIYHKNKPNVGKYTIHGSYGEWCCVFLEGCVGRAMYDQTMKSFSWPTCAIRNCVFT